MKYFSLFIFTIQNAATMLAIRYSRKQTDGKDIYIATTLILTSELLKFALFILLLIYQTSGSLVLTWQTLKSEVFLKPWETTKMAIPSSMYTMQNNLIILALYFLDSSTFKVTYQLKILTTAFFSVVLLRKELKPLQWLSLIVLMAGIILVQFPFESKSEGITGVIIVQFTSDLNSEEIEFSGTDFQRLFGFFAVFASTMFSAFAGVYYEKLLKESSQPSVIIRNIQLGIFSIIFTAAGVFIKDWDELVQRGFFDGYTPVAWLIIMLQLIGGLLVAVVIKFADNILKGFASSFSIIIFCLVSHTAFHDLNLKLEFILGAGLILCATFLYGIQSPHQPRPDGGTPSVRSQAIRPVYVNPCFKKSDVPSSVRPGVYAFRNKDHFHWANLRHESFHPKNKFGNSNLL